MKKGFDLNAIVAGRHKPSAILQVAWAHKSFITEIFCPGLATGIGGVPEKEAAREMAAAYRKWRRKIDQ